MLQEQSQLVFESDVLPGIIQFRCDAKFIYKIISFFVEIDFGSDVQLLVCFNDHNTNNSWFDIIKSIIRDIENICLRGEISDNKITLY